MRTARVTSATWRDSASPRTCSPATTACRGDDVLMVSGTDEHGTPIMVAADAEGVSPRELADRTTTSSARTCVDLGLSYDLFTRTTTENHHHVVARRLPHALRPRLHHRADDARRVLRRDRPARCPTATSRARARSAASPRRAATSATTAATSSTRIDLIDPRSKIDGEPPEFRETTHLFLDLPAFKEQLDGVDRQAGALAAERQATSRSSSSTSCEPRAITRDLDWGVPMPVAGYDDRDDKRIYVWIDAVVGYLSAAVEWARTAARPTPGASGGRTRTRATTTSWARTTSSSTRVIWPSHAARLRHGRRDRRGHGRLQLPYDIVSSEFLTMEGKQFSTSRGVVILRRRLPRAATTPDALRYYLDRGRPGDAGHRLHVGRVRAPQQRRARRELGQPRQPHAHERPPELRRGARAGRADRRRRRVLARGRGGFESVGDADRAGPLPGGARGGDAARVARQPVRRATRRRGRSSRPTASAPRPCSTSRCARSTT